MPWQDSLVRKKNRLSPGYERGRYLSKTIVIYVSDNVPDNFVKMFIFKQITDFLRITVDKKQTLQTE
jgi:hypothetical protein